MTASWDFKSHHTSEKISFFAGLKNHPVISFLFNVERLCNVSLWFFDMHTRFCTVFLFWNGYSKLHSALNQMTSSFQFFFYVMKYDVLVWCIVTFDFQNPLTFWSDPLITQRLPETTFSCHARPAATHHPSSTGADRTETSSQIRYITLIRLYYWYTMLVLICRRGAKIKGTYVLK